MGTLTANQSLCVTCLGLLVRPCEELGEKSYILYSRSSIKEAAKNDCFICWHIYTCLKELFPGNRSLQLWAPQGSLGVGSSSKLLSNLPISEIEHETGTAFIEIYGGENELAYSLLFGINGYKMKEGTTLLKTERFHPTHPYDVPINEQVLALSSSDESRLVTLDTWIATCYNQHRSCRRLTRHESTQSAPVIMPSRLIDVTDVHGLRVVETEGIVDHTGVCYATVSHRWRQGSMPKLLRSNVHLMKQHIDIHSLPVTFQDSINLCKRLDIRYLWIDALCLIQDDPEDRTREISLMGEIYAMAVLNIAAEAAARTPEMGLFVRKDDIQKLAPTRLRLERKGFSKDLIAFFTKSTHTLTNSALLARGWVLQERILSPRSVYFGAQLTWECAEMVANEVFPEGLPHVGKVAYWGATHPLRLETLLQETDGVCPQPTKSEIYGRWLILADRFSDCELTFDRDAMPAISGLAKAFSACLQDRYVAGLWEGDILHGLLWYCAWSHRPFGEAGEIYPTSYRAPSWSWLAVKRSITFPVQAHHDWKAEPRFIAHVKCIDIELASENPFGEVSGGYMRIQCHIRPGHDRLAVRPPRRYRIATERFDDGYDEEGKRSVKGFWFCVLAYRPSQDESDTWDHGYIMGLILEAVELEPHTYRRIGLFSHPWGGGDFLQKFEERCPEFADVEDPGIFEKCEITIV